MHSRTLSIPPLILIDLHRAIAMAIEFPHARVVAVDLAPSGIDDPPPNCTFELDDINHGLPHFYGQFDVVHMRSVGSGVSL
jgi:hypothetical protein